ncbi:MAG: hypothetical protein AAGK04_05435 [Planctomycetota bacterium]
MSIERDIEVDTEHGRRAPYVPPPPSGPPGRRAAMAAAKPTGPAPKAPLSPPQRPAPTRPGKRGDRPVGYRFEAAVEVSQLDDRARPGPTWSARAMRLSRSNLVFTARRMCYVDAALVLAVHLIDSTPVRLFGMVHHCEYEGDGLYRVDIDLMEPPESAELDEWVRSRSAARRAGGARVA